MSAKMLIATDGSKYGEAAADYGLGLAKKLDYEVLALYVVNLKSLELFAISHHDDIGGYERANDELKAEGAAALGYVAAKGKEIGVPVVKMIVRGHPAEEIVAIAVRENVDVIVVGNLGKTGLKHMLMGSVSESVVRKAPCPVWVARETQTH